MNTQTDNINKINYVKRMLMFINKIHSFFLVHFEINKFKQLVHNVVYSFVLLNNKQE